MLSRDRSTGESKPGRRFVTVARRDPEFSSYLEGRGPDGLLALPVESFAVNSPRERVTFVLEPTSANERPAWWRRFIHAGRFELLTLTLGPVLLAVAAAAGRRADLDWLSVGFMLLSLIALHVSAFARNDYDDHRQGIDRIQRKRGSQVIQKGWLSAAEVRNLSRAALLVSVIAGLPVLHRSDVAVSLLAMIALAAVIGFSFSGRGFKYQGAGDIVVGLCMGPLLTLGVLQVLDPEQGLWSALLGVPLGLSAIIVFQLRQLETIMAERTARSGTLMSRLGFDRAKKWIEREFWLIPLVSALALWPWASKWYLVALLIVTFAGQAPLSWRLRRARSPLSSDLVGLARRALYYHLGLAVILMILVGRAA